MISNDYVAQKLRQLDEELLNHDLIAARMHVASHRTSPRTKPVIGPALRFAGRTLRRVGGGLEDWAAPPPEADLRSFERRTG
jgi:hypothetical protein